MNPFERYDHPEHVELDAPNWSRRDDGSHIRRADGAIVTRTTSSGGGWLMSFREDPERSIFISWKDLGETGTVAALRYVDATRPLPSPDPRVGQVWFVIDENGATAETMVLAVIRVEDMNFVMSAGDPAPTPWDPSGGLLVAGPGAPWAPPGWTP